MRPWDRSNRKVVGEGVAEPRELERALWARDRDRHRAREVAGQKAVVRETKLRNSHNLAQPRPNAPLLKRIVRYPKVYEGQQTPVRSVTREPVPWDVLRHERIEFAGAAARKEMVRPAAQHPVAEARALRSLERIRWSDKGGAE